jgi:tetratricopeptide (TPR) repeat protein
MSSADQLKEAGIQQYSQHEYEEAIRTFERAKDAYNTEGQEDMAAEMMVNIGLAHRALGEGQQALEVMQQALKIFQKLQDGLRSAQVLGNIGGAYAKIGDKEQAFNAYRQAADLFEELGDKEKYGQTLLAMGKLQLDDGKFLSGAATYQVALENIEKPTFQQRVIKNLGSTVDKILGGGPISSGSDESDDEKPSK